MCDGQQIVGTQRVRFVLQSNEYHVVVITIHRHVPLYDFSCFLRILGARTKYLDNWTTFGTKRGQISKVVHLSRWFKHGKTKTGQPKSGLFLKVVWLSWWSHFKVPLQSMSQTTFRHQMGALIPVKFFYWLTAENRIVSVTLPVMQKIKTSSLPSNIKWKYTMYPWSLHLFMGGQCTLAVGPWRPY